MGHMKDLYITVYGGGDEAVAAVQRMSEDWRAQLEQAADEIERLREAIRRLAEQDATLSVQGGNVTVEMDATLTDAEREALEFVAGWLEDGAIPDTINHSRHAAIRGMLERLGSVE